MASGTSKETELKLTNVARASLEELLEDYRDFLRTRRAAQWAKDSKEALYVRRLASGKLNGTHVTDGTDATISDSSPRPHRSSKTRLSSAIITYDDFQSFEDRPAEVRVNICISLIHQTNYLLDQQLRRLEQDFLKEGGLRERMTRARLEARDQQRKLPRGPLDNS